MIPRKADLKRKARLQAKREAVKATPDPDRSPDHLVWIAKTFVCACWESGECAGRIDAHHVGLPALHLRTGDQLDATAAGTGVKVPDWQAAPLCRWHHTELHQKGLPWMEKTYGVDLIREANRLAAISPFKHRANRT